MFQKRIQIRFMMYFVATLNTKDFLGSQQFCWGEEVATGYLSLDLNATKTSSSPTVCFTDLGMLKIY
jgi:hypothetical protein